MDDAAGAEEEQRLEEGVGPEVEVASERRPRAERRHHEAQLRAGGVRKHPLDVGLHQAQERGEGRGHRADPEHAALDPVSLGEEWIGPHHQVHARGHHRRRVEQRRDRRRALHRVGEPDVQWELRRLPHHCEEDEPGRRLRHLGPERDVPGEGARARIEEEQREQEAHVRELGHPEGLHRGPGGGRTVEVEPDEEVADEADQLPPCERLEQVRRQHQGVHAEEEERVVGEVPTVGARRFAVHVRDRVDLDRQGHQTHDAEHRDGHRVETDAHLAQSPALDHQPGHRGADGTPGHVLHQEQRGGPGGQEAPEDGQDGRRHAAVADGRDHDGDERGGERRDQRHEGQRHRGAHPFASLARSSSVSPCRR